MFATWLEGVFVAVIRIVSVLFVFSFESTRAWTSVLVWVELLCNYFGVVCLCFVMLFLPLCVFFITCGSLCVCVCVGEVVCPPLWS